MIHAINGSAGPYTLVINTQNHALTEYTNFSFNSIAKIGNVYIAASADGIYVLDESATDNGTNIDAEIQTGLIDTLTSIPKEAIIAGTAATGTAEATLSVGISIDDGEEYTYPALQSGSGIHREFRAKFGRGLNQKGRYARVRVSNELGSPFAIDSVRVYSNPARKQR